MGFQLSLSNNLFIAPPVAQLSTFHYSELRESSRQPPVMVSSAVSNSNA